MKCRVPEISWHNRDPVLSLDIHQAEVSSGVYRLATGGNDSHVVVWHVKCQDPDEVQAEAVADLTHHLKPVNAVRFSPQQQPALASADDDGNIILWRMQPRDSEPAGASGEAGGERYSIWKTLRGHLQDVYDLCWSPNGSHLISGAVDNTAILWNVHKGSAAHVLRNHESFVQGVSWDPRGRYVATLSCDRHCRVYLTNNGRRVGNVHRCKLPAAFDKEGSDKMTRLFHDDTLQTFCRRLTFTPDGSLLLAPSGILEPPAGAPVNVVHVFSRHDFSKPVFCMPTDKYTVAIRCCPRRFCLRVPGPIDASRPVWQQTDTLLKLPYRMVIAVATSRAVMLYDTQQKQPFATVSNIHFTRLTDLSWSSDGLLLCASSTDGFCSLITFEPHELGEEYCAAAPLHHLQQQEESTSPVDTPMETDQHPPTSDLSPSSATTAQQDGGQPPVTAASTDHSPPLQTGQVASETTHPLTPKTPAKCHVSSADGDQPAATPTAQSPAAATTPGSAAAPRPRGRRVQLISLGKN